MSDCCGEVAGRAIFKLRMKDESEGWEIQEYSPSGGDGDGKMMTTTRTSMIRGGLRIGKTIIVTGVVLSSAPFVLPTLIVVSAVGLACSVPFGVFVASYACTEKLMSKLLPMPRPPPPLPLMLEYRGQEDEINYFDLGSEGDEEDKLMGETEADLESRVYEDGEIGGANMEEEEERFIEDTKATVEMRIALPVAEERETVPEDKYDNGKSRVEEHKVEEGYREDDENSTQEEEQLPAISENEMSGSEIHPLVEILRQERPVDNVKVDDSNLAQKTHEDIICEVVEVEGPYGLTIGAIEQTTVGKEAGDADQGEQSWTIDVEGSFEDKRSAGETKKDKSCQFTAKRRTIEVDDVHKTGVEGRADMSGTLETAVYTPPEQITRKPECELAKTKDMKAKQSINITPINVEFVGETQYPKKPSLDDQHIDAINTTERKKKSKKKKPASGETSTEGSKKKKPASGETSIEGATLSHPEQQEGAISSNADARCISDEIRLNLVGDKHKPGEEIHSSKKAAGIVHPTESGTTSRTPSARSLRASPKKALFSEEKIWENIEALRTIVGYKVARHGTCMEELKALYIFTGVEPPISFKSSPDVRDSPDLVEVNDMLRFLMAIVGVK